MVTTNLLFTVQKNIKVVLKSEAEVKEGKRHGRYREYHENGKLKLRGKYSNNQPKGTWKYYTEEGEFERKEKF